MVWVCQCFYFLPVLLTLGELKVAVLAVGRKKKKKKKKVVKQSTSSEGEFSTAKNHSNGRWMEIKEGWSLTVGK